MQLPLSSCVYAAAAVLLSGVAPVTSAPTPRIAPRPLQSPLGPGYLPLILKPLLRSRTPDMARMPKSYLVSGLLAMGGRTFFTGPNGAIVLGPMRGAVVPCSSIPCDAQRR